MAETETAAAEPAVNARGEITLPLGGEEYGLRPSRFAIEEIEKKLRPLAGLVADCYRGDLGLKEMAVVSAELMKAHGRAYPDLPNLQTYMEAGIDRLSDLIYEAGIDRIRARIQVILFGALNGGYTAAGEMKPAEKTSE